MTGSSQSVGDMLFDLNRTNVYTNIIANFRIRCREEPMTHRSCFIGIDQGSSSTKALALSIDGEVLFRMHDEQSPGSPIAGQAVSYTEYYPQLRDHRYYSPMERCNANA